MFLIGTHASWNIKKQYVETAIKQNSAPRLNGIDTSEECLLLSARSSTIYVKIWHQQPVQIIKTTQSFQAHLKIVWSFQIYGRLVYMPILKPNKKKLKD